MSSAEVNSTAASLLGFLHSGPMTGWELDRAVGMSISNFWNLTRSQVYRELRTLAGLGYVEAGSAGPRERRPYTITPAGRAAFAEWIKRDPGPAIVRMPLLLTVFFGEHLEADRLADIVEKERQIATRQLAKFRQMLDCWEGSPYVAEVLRFAIGYQELMLGWLARLPVRTPPAEGGAPDPDG